MDEAELTARCCAYAEAEKLSELLRFNTAFRDKEKATADSVSAYALLRMLIDGK